MQARRIDSIKWTSLPEELSLSVVELFKEHFKGNLDKKRVQVDGKIYPSELLFRLSFGDKTSLKQNNFWISVDLERKNQDALEQIHICVDATAAIVEEFFESEEAMDLPPTWKQFKFEKKEVYFCYSTENPDLESQADALLGKSQKLFNEDVEDPSDDEGSSNSH